MPERISMFLQALSWVAAALGITGAVLNAYRNYWCLILWELANALLVVYSLATRQYSQVALFSAYFIITGFALYKWTRNNQN